MTTSVRRGTPLHGDGVARRRGATDNDDRRVLEQLLPVGRTA